MVLSNSQWLANPDTGYEIDQSIRFNDDDSAYLTRTPSSEGNRRTFTFSTWVKFNTIKADNVLFASWIASGPDHYALVYIDSNFNLRFDDQNGTGIRTSRVFRDVAAWYHVVVRVDTTDSTSSDRYQMYINGVRVTSFAAENQPSQNYQTNINKTQPHYLGRNGYSLAMLYSDLYQAETHFLDGTAYDASFFGETDSATGQWIPKKYTGGNYGTNGFYITGEDSTFLGQDVRTSGDQVNSFQASQWTGATGSYTFTDGRIQADTDNKAIKSVDTFTGDFEFSWRYIDMANFVIGFYEIDEDSTFSDSSSAGNMQNMTDSWYVQTSSVAANRDIYYGGAVQVNATTIANGDTWKLQRSSGTIKVYRNGSVVHTFSQTSTNEVRLVVAQGDASADVGEVNWVDNATLGNNFFSSGLSTADQVTDTPTNNTATWNSVSGTVNPATLSDGNLTAVKSGSGTGIERSTISFPATENFYAEFTIDATGSGSYVWQVGVIRDDDPGLYQTSESRVGDEEFGYAYSTNWSSTPVPNKSNNGTKTSYGTAGSAGHVIGVQLNDGSLTFYHNNSSQGVAFTGLSGNFLFAFSGQGGAKVTANFGQTGFTYTPPTGAKALTAPNLPDPTIALPTNHFDTLLWSGDSSNKNITGLNFTPDWVWIKQRNQAFSVGHQLYDVVRGAGSEKELDSSKNTAEGGGNAEVYGYVSAFVSGGFTATAGSSGDWDYVNKSGVNYVAWNWLANNTTGSSNSNGSITSTVAANTTSGFSVGIYTGNGTDDATVGHGLGGADMVWVKRRNTTGNWRVYEKSSNKLLYLDLTNAGASPTEIKSTSSTTFTLGSGNGFNGNEDTHVFYAFQSIDGFSKIGSYEGNGSADGSFVYTGFKPAFILTKNIDTTDQWGIRDSARNPSNVTDKLLYPNADSTETSSSTGYIDILSNGFKARSSDSNINSNTIIYMAIAESPFKTANAR